MTYRVEKWGPWVDCGLVVGKQGFICGSTPNRDGIVNAHNAAADAANAELERLEKLCERTVPIDWYETQGRGIATLERQLNAEREAHAATKRELEALKREVEGERVGMLELRRKYGARDDETFAAFLERLATAPSPSAPKELEALMWEFRSRSPFSAFVVGSDREVCTFHTGSDHAQGIRAHNESVLAADRIGYERGKREGTEDVDFAAELKRLREAVPKDDGRRWQVVESDGTAWWKGHGFTQSTATEIANVMHLATRPVEPKHEHEFYSWYDVATESPKRKCPCGVVQVARWEDAKEGER